jgi:hypothetical protein
MKVAFTRGAIYESSHEGQADAVKILTLSPKQRRDLVEELATTFPELAFDRSALDIFLDASDHGRWKGKSAAGWFRSVNLRDRLVPDTDANFCTTAQDRKTLRAYCRQNDVSDLETLVAVMAWGGMSVRNGRLALRAPRATMEVVRQIRHSILDRADDYDRFYRARREGSMIGIGPAYYTKLLFFIRPKPDSYILDQWTARSIHVLTGSREFPRVARLPGNQARVSDSITPQGYEKYCRIVDVIASHAGPMKWTGADVEERLFSEGGRAPKPWREYVKKRWPSLP